MPALPLARGYSALKKGFTLTELLVVIAIISILAAIIFPVFSSVRENARRTTCASNLNQIYVAFETYRLDYGGQAPPALFGYVLGQGNSCAIQAPNMDQLPNNEFLRHYLKNSAIFQCPNNPTNDRGLLGTAVYPAGHALAGQTVREDPFDNSSPVKCFYQANSYDTGRRLDTSQLELRYTLFWSNETLNGVENQLNGGTTNYGLGYYDPPVGGKPSDTPRQLGYRKKEPSAVVTWCTHHRKFTNSQVNKGKDDLVLFASGNVARFDSSTLTDNPYNRRP